MSSAPPEEIEFPDRFWVTEPNRLQRMITGTSKALIAVLCSTPANRIFRIAAVGWDRLNVPVRGFLERQ
jgi:hypothetical protein